MKKLISKLQPIGRALMLPIAVLPVAALLLRLGQPDLLDIAGDRRRRRRDLLQPRPAVRHRRRGGPRAREPRRRGARRRGRLPGRDQGREGADRRAARGHRAISRAAPRTWRPRPSAPRSSPSSACPSGILSGLIAGWAYNRYSDIRLPSYLAFFGGRRFVPIVSGFAGLVLALVFGFGWPDARAAAWTP